jgi:beta-glucanase (GH16 family)
MENGLTTQQVRRTDYSEEYHTYGLEWSEDYMFMYLDSKLLQVQYINFRGKKDMYTKGGFGSMTVNGSV